MTALRLPKKINNFLDKLIANSNKRVSLREVASFGISGMKVAFDYDEDNFYIDILESYANDLDEADKEDFYRSVFHEAMHGWLLLVEGFYMLESKEKFHLSDEEMKIKSILFSMISDIAVNFRIRKEGFSPFPSSYPSVVKNETEAFRVKKDYYSSLRELGDFFCSKFKINRYISAWSFVRYFDLDENAKSILSNFFSSFKEGLPSEYEECERIIDLIEQNNLFSSEGQKVVMAKISEMWGLAGKTNLIQLK